MEFNCRDGFELTIAAAARSLRPQEKLPTKEWAAKYRRLPRGKSSESGKWNPDRVPFLNGIMDALEDDHPAQTVVYIKSAQTGGSEVALNWIGRNIHQAPTAMMCLFPGEKEGGKWTRGKLNPMLRNCKELRAILPPGRQQPLTAEAKEETEKTIREKHFPGGTLYTGSGNIANDLAQITVQYGVMDDADRIALVLDKEGDPGELFKMRLATHPLRKLLIISTPTTDEESRVQLEWRQSTQDHYFVPCLRCGERQPLSFENLKWPASNPKAAEYQCEHCAAMLPHSAKTEMLANGEWRSTHPEREADIKGFHSNGLMTPVGLGYTWGEHAAAWDRTQGNPAKVQVYYNTRRGEVWKSNKVKLEWESVAARREPYKLRTIPPGILLLTAGADVQGDRIEAGIVGWGRDERSAVIDYTTFFDDPTRPEVWAALDTFLAGEIQNSFGVAMRLSCALIDSGNWQHEVTNFTRTRRGRNIFASKGSSIRTRPPIGKPTLVDVNYRGVSQKRGAEQYQLGVTVMKTTLYARLAADADALPASRHVRFSEELTDEFFRQLTAERYDPKEGWQKHYDRNEALDVVIMATGAAMHHSTQVHRMRELDWQRLEQLYQPAEPPKVGAPPPPTGRNAGWKPLPARGS